MQNVTIYPSMGYVGVVTLLGSSNKNALLGSVIFIGLLVACLMELQTIPKFTITYLNQAHTYKAEVACLRFGYCPRVYNRG
jgi:hypothetical protein